MVITNIIANIRKRNPNTNLMVIPTKTILTLLSLVMTQMTRTTVPIGKNVATFWLN